MNGDNYHKCDPQVENYKTCKHFWVNNCRYYAFARQLIGFQNNHFLFSRQLYAHLLLHIIY